jgi:hypothetical protein
MKKKSNGGVFKIVCKPTGHIWICASMDIDKEYADIMKSCEDGTFEERFQEEYVREGVGRISRRGTPKIGDVVH